MSLFFVSIFIFIAIVIHSQYYYRNYRVLGISFHPQHAKSHILNTLLKKIRWVHILISVLQVILFYILMPLIPEQSLDFYWLAYLLFILIIQMGFMLIAQQKIRHLKAKMRWTGDRKHRVVDSRITASRGKSKPSVLWVWLGWSLSLVSAIIPLSKGMTYWLAWLVPLLIPITLLILPLSYNRAVDGQTVALAQDLEMSKSYENRVENIRGKTYIALTFMLSIFNFILMFVMFQARISMPSLFLTILVLFITLILILFWDQKNIAKVDSEMIDLEYTYVRDTQDRIKAGFYYDKEDKRIMVPKPSGLGTTLNLGSKGGKIVAGLTVAGLIGIFAFVLYLMGMRFHFELDAHKLDIQAGPYSYEILREDISELDYRTEQVEEIRLNGYGGQGKSFGIFRIEGYGVSRLYSYNSNDEHIAIRLVSTGQWILINLSEEEDTRTFYQALEDWLETGAMQPSTWE